MEFVSFVVVGWSLKALGREGENLISFFLDYTITVHIREEHYVHMRLYGKESTAAIIVRNPSQGIFQTCSTGPSCPHKGSLWNQLKAWIFRETLSSSLESP